MRVGGVNGTIGVISFDALKVCESDLKPLDERLVQLLARKELLKDETLKINAKIKELKALVAAQNKALRSKTAKS